VVEVELHRAKTRNGAKLLTVNTQPHALSDYADEWLRPEPRKETDLIQQLANLAGSAPMIREWRPPAAGTQVERAARMLREADQPAIILGPAFLAHPDHLRLLVAVETLVENCGAQVSVLSEQGNLTGALLLGGLCAGRVDPQEFELLYLIGAAVPTDVSRQTRILYQNIYPPDSERPVDLLLPAASFSEVDGTLIDYAGQVRSLHLAVPAPGQALPTWEILCRIARQMGAPGFDYASAADIRAEMAGWLYDGQVDWKKAPRPAFASLPIIPQVSEHEYMGFPLSHWVEGLRMIYPEE
jgi:NADH dehydrogenase/NADH:ubiquinone oxidoreductase subunit G